MKQLACLLFTLAVLLAFSACRSTKSIQKVIEKKDSIVVAPMEKQPTHEDTMRLVYEVLQSYKPIAYSNFSARIKVDYTTSKGKQPDFVANLRMRKDSLIWISIGNDIGIEGFRVLINKDSIHIMDKLANTYQVRPLASLQEISEVPFTFADVQELIVGNPVFFNRDSVLQYARTDRGYSLLSIGTVFRNLLSIGNDLLLSKSKLDDINPLRTRTADLSYAEYETRTGFPFSTLRQLFFSQQNKLDVELKFKDYRFNEELTFPFNVPKKFKRIK